MSKKTNKSEVSPQAGDKTFSSLADLTPDPANARKHNPRNVGMLIDALHQVGAARSIVVDENGVVLAGNATIEAAAEAGIHKVKTVEADGSEIVAVVRRGLSQEQKTKLALYDNRVAELAEWNPEILAELIDTKALEGMFSDKELAEILTQTGIEPKDAEPQIDKAEELRQKWGTETGQLWEIGPHLLLCGDSGLAGDVLKLMGDSRATLAPVDPPYNVDFLYDGETVDDSKSEEEYEKFSRAWFGLTQQVSDRQIVTPGCNNLARWCRYFDPYHVAPWTKTNSMTNGKVARWWCWEPLMFFGDKWARSRSNDVFEFPISNQKDIGDHPCPKPLGMWADIIDNYSERGDLLYEAFAGSGTTLVAAENLNRKCYAIEISPAYVAVCLERMTTAFSHLKIEKADQARAA